MATYANIELRVTPGSSQDASNARYQVYLVDSPAGEAIGTFHLNTTDDDFVLSLKQVRDAFPDSELRHKFGRSLFNALFTGKIRDAWNRTLGIQAQFDGGIRIRLGISVAEVSEPPWELLCDEDDFFLVTKSRVGLSRYLPMPEPTLLDVEGELRVLLVVQAPTELPPIELDDVAAIQEAIQELGDRVDCQMRHNLPIATLHELLMQNEYHVLHYFGHGIEDKLMFVGQQGECDPVTSTDFAQLFQGRATLRLVVLNACYSSNPAGGACFLESGQP